jgi:hypothetical protein
MRKVLCVPLACALPTLAHATFTITATEFDLLSGGHVACELDECIDGHDDLEHSTTFDLDYSHRTSVHVDAGPGRFGGEGISDGQTDLVFDAFGTPDLIRAGGDTTGQAVQHAGIFPHDGVVSIFPAKATAQGSDSLTVRFTVTDAWTFTIDASVHSSTDLVPEGTTAVKLEGPGGTLFQLAKTGSSSVSGVLEPGDYILEAFTQQVSVEAPRSSVNGSVTDGFASFSEQWNLDLRVAPLAPDTDVPIPLWALGALSAAMIGIARRRLFSPRTARIQ